MGEPREIDRLIEEGLLLYGQGQLDAALMIWEQALSVDPDNPQANSYVDYVRMNYELLTNDSGTDEPTAGFGLDDEPYKVEVGPGEIATAGAPAHADAADEGWFIEGELSTRGARGGDEPGPEPPARTVQMEADEPPDPKGAEPALAPVDKSDERPTRSDAKVDAKVDDKPVSFDDETREYPKGERPKISVVVEADPDPSPDAPPVHLSHVTELGLGLPERPPATGAFAEGTVTAVSALAGHVDREFDGPELTPGPAAFQSLPTETKKRELGFVQPRPELPLPAPATDDPPEEMELPQRRHRKTGPPPELKMTLRTPFRAEEPPPSDPEIPSSDPGASRQSSTNAPTAELDPREPGPRIAAELAAAALVSTLPTPLRSSRAITPVAMPPPPPLPAISKAPTTRMMSGEISIPDLPVESNAPTRELPMSVLPPREDPLISAPTRELGMRPPFVPIRTAEDDPTKELVRGAKPPGVISRLEPAGAIVAAADAEGTRQEPPPTFDPIETRSMQILDDIDAGTSDSESKDDRTRRRITALLDRAVEWSRTGELDKSVTAVDLALAEDPNAALAQKLIHRNRDTIMTVFQSYIGDLDRTPVLARPLHELAKAPISPRAAFLLSRVDGALTLDEILDVSGMPRLEAYRYLSQLLLRGILR